MTGDLGQVRDEMSALRRAVRSRSDPAVGTAGGVTARSTVTSIDRGPGGPEDEEALRALSTDYAAAVDGRDGDGFAALFTDDGELVVPDVPRRPPAGGHPPRPRRPGPGARRCSGATTRTFHQVSDHRFSRCDGDTAPRRRCGAWPTTCRPPGTAPRPGTRRSPARPGPTRVWFIRYRRPSTAGTGAGVAGSSAGTSTSQWVEEHPVARLGRRRRRGREPAGESSPSSGGRHRLGAGAGRA